jgi:hypothetical protein
MKTGNLARSSLTLVPVVLLLCSVAFHGFQIVVHEDDAQRSGAFAMFATVDIGATRKIIVTAQDGAVVLEVPASLSPQGASLLDHPSREAAAELASHLRGLTWDTVDGGATEGGEDTFGDVRVRVVGLDGEGRSLERTVLVDVVVGASS